MRVARLRRGKRGALKAATVPGEVCGRYSLASNDFSQLRLEWEWPGDVPFEPRYNIAPSATPGHEPWVLLPGPGGMTAQRGRFWFIPRAWRKPLSALPTSFNARAEELAQKPFFHGALKERRCLVPATGWREFAGPPGRRQPFHFHFEHRPLVFAGIWDRWLDSDGQAVVTFAIVTTAARGRAAEVHGRMPLRLAPDLASCWLDPTAEPGALLGRAVVADLPEPDFYAADPVGNAVRVEGPEVIAPAPEPQQLRLFR